MQATIPGLTTRLEGGNGEILFCNSWGIARWSKCMGCPNSWCAALGCRYVSGHRRLPRRDDWTKTGTLRCIAVNSYERPHSRLRQMLAVIHDGQMNSFRRPDLAISARWTLLDCAQPPDRRMTPATSTPHPTSRHAPTFSRRISMPMSAPTIIDISRIGATRLSGAPEVSAARIRI